MYEIELPARLILLPGVGANHRLYTLQKRVFGDALITPDWIKPRANESIGSLAARWAEQLKAQLDPDDPRPLLVGGASIGGMIALEMARPIGAQAVILIGSARRGEDVPATSRLADWVGRLLPDKLLPHALKATLVPWSVAEDLDDDGFALMKQMADEVDPAVVKWTHGAIADWEFDGDPGVPVAQIHGRQDRVLPCPPDADQVIPDGHHLIALTHDRVVNEFIVRAVEDHVGQTAVPVL